MILISSPDRVLHLKLTLLAGSYIKIGYGVLKRSEEDGLKLSRMVSRDNLYAFPWIFIRLSKVNRVRMVVVPETAPFELLISDSDGDRYDILDTKTGYLIAEDLELEEISYHCPRQLFYDLYEFCFMGCKFCPLAVAPRWTRDTLEKMIRDLDRLGIDNLDGIGLTAGIPAHLSGDKVALEMARIVRSLRAKVGSEIPIGISPMQPSSDVLIELKGAGADEVRINLEVYNHDLARLLIPRKDPERTFQSIADAVDIFGRGKVSSNLLLGIGESDEDVIRGVEELAKLGAVATLYPYDSLSGAEEELSVLTDGKARRPNAERLLKLAIKHKSILGKYMLDPKGLKTMCPGCSASHIMPSIDL